MKKRSSNKSVGNKKRKIDNETLYLMSSEPNRKRLQSAVDEMNLGVYQNHKLIELA